MNAALNAVIFLATGAVTPHQLHLQVMQEGDEYRITSIHQEKAPATDGAAKPAAGEMDKMEGMDPSQHDMGAKP